MYNKMFNVYFKKICMYLKNDENEKRNIKENKQKKRYKNEQKKSKKKKNMLKLLKPT